MDDKKKPESKCKWLERALVFGPHLCLCLSNKDFQEKLDDMKIPKSKRDQFITIHGKDAQVHTYEKSSDSGAVVCIVALRNYCKRSICSIFALLAHEAAHIWREARNEIGEFNPSSEFEAYAIQAICLELFTSFCVQTGRKNLTCLAKEKRGSDA
jgi:hypothetical protein